MANYLNPLEGHLEHRRGRRQPTEEESSSTDSPVVQPLEANQEASFEAHNISTEAN